MNSTEPTDGPIASDPLSRETTLDIPPVTLPLTPRVETPAERKIEEREANMRGAAETLRNMGLNRKSMRKLLAANKDAGYLDMKVTGRIALVFWLDSAEKVVIAQERCLKLADEAVDAKVRVAALQCVAQCGTAIGNLGLLIDENGQKYGNKEEKPRLQPPQLHQTNVNVFPPAAPLPPTTSG